MRIKLDENLPARLADLLAANGHDVHTVHDEGLSGRSDADVWSAASAEQRFLITQDLDFSDSRRFAPGTHPGLMLIRLRDPGRKHFSPRCPESSPSFRLGRAALSSSPRPSCG